MKYYIYHSHKTNDHGGDDVAAVCAATFNDAKEILKNYFTQVKNDNIHEMIFEQKTGIVAEIMIISEY